MGVEWERWEGRRFIIRFSKRIEREREREREREQEIEEGQS